MTFMFFLSGLFVWPSLGRKGARTFVCDRLLRLGVPFVLMACLLMPVVTYPIYRVTAVDPSWNAFWQHWLALPIWPSGPQWFLWELLVLNVAAAALFWLAPRGGELLGQLSASAGAQPGYYFLGLIGASAFAYVPLALAPWAWTQFGPFAFQLSRPLHYAVYFFAGVGAALVAIAKASIVFGVTLLLSWAATATMCRVRLGARLVGSERRVLAKAP
jgi:hypothetical protein